MEWIFHSEAETEFIESAAHYESEAPGLGRRFGRAVKQVLEIIAENPEIGSLLDGELRSFVVAGFPYSIIYACYEDSLIVLAVAHGKRKPGYWRSRNFR